MGYEDSIQYLYGLQRFGIKLGLDNVRELLARLGDPHNSFKSVHVAGSDGKGSVCAFLESILLRAGYRVGLYTSPHLVRFNERIRVNGTEISDEDVVRLTDKVRPHAEAMGSSSRAAQPTFFEFTTVMAFEYFCEREVDIALLEVGMGGRLDATNVVQPEVCVITRICLEHTEYLGRTLDRIAREKAGIIKEGVPVWTVEQPALPVIQERCKDLGCPLRVVGRDVEVRREPMGLDGQRLHLYDGGNHEYEIGLLGTFQAENAALAWGTARELRRLGWRIGEAALGRGLAKTRWPARMEVVSRSPTIIVDATHTPEGALRLRESLEELFPGRRLTLVMGILDDKDLEGIASQLAPLCRRVVATAPATERARPAQEVAAAFRMVADAKVAEPVTAAIRAALEGSSPADVILITGSLYTAGEALTCLEGWRRERALEIVRRLKKTYLPGDFATAELETALGKITRETEDPFVVLVSTVISQRTADPVTAAVASRLFSRFPTADALAAASLEEIEEAIMPANFYRTKAKAIQEIARRVSNEYGGVVPRDLRELSSLPLVGRKTANCVLVYGYGEPAIPVDVHCHRIPNRLGLIRTRTEEETEEELKRLLPREVWLEVNELFVRHGQTTCLPTRPRCDSCTLADLCQYNLQRSVKGPEA